MSELRSFRCVCRTACFGALSIPLFLLVLFVLAGSSAVHAQVPTPPDVVVSDTIYEVRLADGSTIFGRVVAVEGERITLETSGGARLEVDHAQIRSIQPVRGTIRDGEMWADDPNSTRLFFGPTARALGAGAGYFGVFELFFPYLSYGVTDRLALSGGTPVFPEAIGEVFYLAPKYTVVDQPNLDVAAGVLAFFATEEFDEGSVGLLYGVSTFGEPDQAFTVGAGVPFITSADDPIVDEVLVMVGGEVRTGRHTKLISENYLLFGESAAVVSGGIRFFGERLSADAGLGLAVGAGDMACCLPIVNFVYSFGGDR